MVGRAKTALGSEAGSETLLSQDRDKDSAWQSGQRRLPFRLWRLCLSSSGLDENRLFRLTDEDRFASKLPPSPLDAPQAEAVMAFDID